MRKSKTSFFAALERLDDPDDSQDDEVTSLENLLTRSRSNHTPQPIVPTSSTPTEPLSLRRVNTDPQPPSTESDLQITGATRNAPRRRTAIADGQLKPVQRAQTTGTMPDTKSRGGPAKKKRKVATLKMVPSDQQIFKELVFCEIPHSSLCLNCLTTNTVFFPNNDVSPSRRLRIQRAREYGAQCVTEWTEDITHVIVDKGLLYRDLVTHLKITSLSVSNFLGII